MSWPTTALCGVVFDDDGRVLLLAEGAGWRLPGGELPGGEMVARAVETLVLEQTGLEARALQLVGLYTSEPAGRVVASFRVREYSGEVRSAQWFETSALPAVLSERDRLRIADAARFQGEVFLH